MNLRRNRWKRGMRHITRALELSPGDAEYLTTRAWLLLAQGKLTDAAATAHAALTESPDHTGARMVRSLCLLHTGRHNEADAMAAGIVADNPENHSAWYIMGVQLLTMQRYAEARDVLREAVRMNPEDTYARESLLRAEMGCSAFFSPYCKSLYFRRDHIPALGCLMNYLMLYGVIALLGLPGLITSPELTLPQKAVAVAILLPLGVYAIYLVIAEHLFVSKLRTLERERRSQEK